MHDYVTLKNQEAILLDATILLDLDVILGPNPNSFVSRRNSPFHSKRYLSACFFVKKRSYCHIRDVISTTNDFQSSILGLVSSSASSPQRTRSQQGRFLDACLWVCNLECARLS